MPEETKNEAPEQTIGGFKVVKPLGAGGMGSVYLAHDESLNRHIAIKTLAPALQADPVCVERFQREAKSIAAIRHPNLMHIYTVGEDRGTHFFAMEYIEGQALSDVLKTRDTPFSLKVTARFCGQVMSGLSKVHNTGIIHRDLKPANVMIDSDNRPIIVDFGLSKDSDDMGLTSTGAIMGTPDYMAPEQIEGEEVGPYTDIYSLGIIMYEMLTRSKPFNRKSAIMTMRAHCEDPLPPISEFRPDLPKTFPAFLAKVTAREPAKRYQNIAEMARDFAAICPTGTLSNLARASQRSVEGTETIIDQSPSSAAMRNSATHPKSAATLINNTDTHRIKKKSVRKKTPAKIETPLHQDYRIWAGVCAGLLVLMILMLRGCKDEPVKVIEPVVPVKPEPVKKKPVKKKPIKIKPAVKTEVVKKKYNEEDLEMLREFLRGNITDGLNDDFLKMLEEDFFEGTEDEPETPVVEEPGAVKELEFIEHVVKTRSHTPKDGHKITFKVYETKPGEFELRVEGGRPSPNLELKKVGGLYKLADDNYLKSLPEGPKMATKVALSVINDQDLPKRDGKSKKGSKSRPARRRRNF